MYLINIYVPPQFVDFAKASLENIAEDIDVVIGEDVIFDQPVMTLLLKSESYADLQKAGMLLGISNPEDHTKMMQ